MEARSILASTPSIGDVLLAVRLERMIEAYKILLSRTWIPERELRLAWRMAKGAG
jgi:hypothetical protein